MQVRQSEKRIHKVVNETVNGLNIVAHLKAANANEDILETQYMTGQGFDPSNVTLDVQLRRDGKTRTLISTNLAVVAHYWTITMGQSHWYRGKVNVPKSATDHQELERSVFIPFFGHHNIKGSDELIVTVFCGRGTFNGGPGGVALDGSSLLVTTNQSIGVESAIYRFHSQAIQSNMSDENVNLGDNVERVALVSFERDGTKPIFKTCSLTSDRLDWTISEAELALKHRQFFPYNYADVLMSRGWTEQVMKYFPNTFLCHDKDEIDQAKLSVSLHPANVKSSQNYVCWTSFETSREMIAKAVEMQNRHNVENVEKVPDKLV